MLFHNFLSNILFYLFICIKSQFNSMFFFKFKLIIYSLNLALCLHLAINSFLLFNNFFVSGKSKMCILSLEKAKCAIFQIASNVEKLWSIYKYFFFLYHTS